MYSIPQNALRFGAESLSLFPVRYSKSKISGSQNISYILHSKGGSMPGQPELFSINSRSNPNSIQNIKDNQINRAFQINNAIKANSPIGIKYIGNYLSLYTYDQYHPNDDDALEIAIKSCYRQIYGNLYAMESQRPIELERRLRNGDLSIREFIRNLVKSPFYRFHYFESVSQQRSIELNLKHILGRPPFNQYEIIKLIKVLHQEGFDNHIDSIIDSSEYIELFGEHTVPYMRCWNSPNGTRTSSFINSSKLTKSFATSDNAIHKKDHYDRKINGNSLLIKDLAKNLY